jgi:hypothetical protein
MNYLNTFLVRPGYNVRLKDCDPAGVEKHEDKKSARRDPLLHRDAIQPKLRFSGFSWGTCRNNSLLVCSDIVAVDSIIAMRRLANLPKKPKPIWPLPLTYLSSNPGEWYLPHS